MTPASLSVIVSTYEWPEALDAVLRALSEQTDPSFEVVVADDGSGPETASVVRRWAERLDDRVRHVWQPDEGFRRARILNLAALESDSEYLVFMDGDCLPRDGFIAAIRRAALPGWFLATKRIHLSERLTTQILGHRLPVWRWSWAEWVLRARGEVWRPGFFVPMRDRRRPWRPGQPDFTPPDNGYGFFFGVARRDFELVDGWDMRFSWWGCEDVDLALRLRRIGLRCGWPGPGTTLFHLWHARGTAREDARFLANEQLLFDTQASDRAGAVRGLSELRAELRSQDSA